MNEEQKGIGIGGDRPALCAKTGVQEGLVTEATKGEAISLGLQVEAEK